MRLNLATYGLFGFMVTNCLVLFHSHLLNSRISSLEKSTSSLTRNQAKASHDLLAGNVNRKSREHTPGIEIRGETFSSAAQAADECQRARTNPATDFQTVERYFPAPRRERLLQISLARAFEAGKSYTQWDRLRSPSPVYSGLPRSVRNRSHISKIRIWGERHSCTTLLLNLLRKEFPDLPCGHGTGCIADGMPWKHTFLRRRDRKFDYDATTLHILVTKHPYEWLAGMEKLPFHAGLHTSVGLENILTMEWFGFVHGVDELGAINDRLIDIAMQARMRRAKQRSPDRHHITRCAPFGDALFHSEACIIGQDEFKCTVVPGFWVLENDIAKPADACLSRTESQEECGQGAHLCKTGAGLPWVYNVTAWKHFLLSELDRQYGLSFPHEPAKLHEGLDVCAVIQHGGNPSELRSVHVDCLDPPQGSKLYACRKVAGSLVLGTDSESPVEGCLGGKFAWGTCKEGKWLCEAQLAVEGLRVKNGRIERLMAEKTFLSAYLRDAISIPMVGEWLPYETIEERDQDFGFRFPNVLALRTAKLRDWMAATRELKATAHLQCRDLILNRESTLDSLASSFGLTRAKGTTHEDCVYVGGHCQKHLKLAEGKAKSLHGGYMAPYNHHILPIVNAWLDPDVEAQVGYTLHDDLQVAATPYNLSTKCAVHLPQQWRLREC
mmetsp:Transcript_46546/g.109403  ORF Transcript_46546/g.109403 Transcript_46546/m.109403 type:complete len:668 (-) Transcript_46546:444-2447(-)|eukprot:2125439-Rhodomonas_salina.2